MLENANMGSKSWAIMLNEDQVKLMTNTLSSRKPRKLTKS